MGGEGGKSQRMRFWCLENQMAHITKGGGFQCLVFNWFHKLKGFQSKGIHCTCKPSAK